MRLPTMFVCLSVCLLARLLKNACMDFDDILRVDSIGTWTNWSAFEPDPDHSLDAGTGLLSPIAYALQRGISFTSGKSVLGARRSSDGRVVLSRMHCTAEFYYVEKIPRTDSERPSKQLRVVLRRRNTVVGGKCALPIALLVCTSFPHCSLRMFAVNFGLKLQQCNAIVKQACGSSWRQYSPIIN